MIQTQWIVERIHQRWPALEVVVEQIRTTGDRVTNMPLSRIGGDGVFVAEIERALQQRRIDLAVHSLKDLPTAQPEGLCVISPGPREDVRDVLVSNGNLRITEQGILEGGSIERAPRIGTCSLRRTAQIRHICPEAEILSLRGNVDTRLRKLQAGEYDAIVLAAAGLHRMNLHTTLEGQISYFPLTHMLPAPGQGALGLETREEPELRDLLTALQDKNVQATTSAERMFMRRLGAGCYLPVAAHAWIHAERMELSGLVTSLDGQRRILVRQNIIWDGHSLIESAERLGIEVAEEALAQGAQTIIAEVDGSRAQEHQHA
ncbi:hydroxymethylbilane synthase [Ktedonospora formicarum]|uniref:Hydroxymethylbilane synthase n=1 Tax=Ktedonospora formicarum TaxID=2778364 RepID=A0A8J3IDJ2_9CHLR|nr:hydroxymethylbilane synthase [Ktedonospora formicarum]GHO50074.1 porphobilinogen deaminase [Ktedonospora formicarum]